MHDDFRLVWMLREPRSVVYSMLHNWKRGALNRLFDACGEELLRSRSRARCSARGSGRRDSTRRAPRTSRRRGRPVALLDRLGDRMAIVDYDELVSHKDVAASAALRVRLDSL